MLARGRVRQGAATVNAAPGFLRGSRTRQDNEKTTDMLDAEVVHVVKIGVIRCLDRFQGRPTAKILC